MIESAQAFRSRIDRAQIMPTVRWKREAVHGTVEAGAEERAG